MSDDEKITALLARISDSASALESVARANLRRDLDGVVQRLEARAYSETDFIIRDPFDVQRRTHEYLTYVDGWRVQAERLAELVGQGGLEHAAHVIELCPGWAPKTLMALAILGYAGRVTVVDSSREALQALLGFSRALQPNLRIATLEADVLADTLEVSGDVVIANHILDDLVLDRWARAAKRGMHELYEDTTLLREAWQSIAADRATIEHTFLPTVATVLAGCTLPGGRLLLTHYPSNVERALQATEASQLFAELFDSLCAMLESKGMQKAACVPPAGFQAALLVKPASGR